VCPVGSIVAELCDYFGVESNDVLNTGTALRTYMTSHSNNLLVLHTFMKPENSSPLS